MACGMLAMRAAGVKIDRYVAFEIDKYAVKTSDHNFPMIEHRGDVFKADFTEFTGFDFLVGGSPCTYWSIAQKNNRETEASGMGWELFSQYVRALHEAKPKWFIYENNKSMSAAIRQSITETFGFEPICINSALVSAQNRNRLYWVGKRNEDGTYSKVDVEQPEDRGILLRDVLDYAVIPQTASGKARTVDAHYKCLETNTWYNRVFSENPNKQQHDYVAEPVCGRYERSPEAKAVRKQYEAHEIHHGFHELSELHPRTDGKTNTLSTVLKDNPIIDPVCVAQRGRYSDTEIEQHYEARPDGKTNVLTTVQTKAISAADGKTYTVYAVEDGKITIKGKQYPIKLIDGYYIIRKLTVSECKRLQTVPEWYEFPVSDSQAYKMLGNGWTVEVIAHLIRATQ